METITLEEWERMRERKRSKYGNRKVERDGYTFDSQAEFGRYLQLREKAGRGDIHNLQVHETFVLLDGFTDRYGKRQRAITHEVDFSYDCKGTRVVEDVKGVQTAVWKLKHKLFLSRYPEIDYRVVEV